MKALNLLRVVAHKDWGADCATLLKLYRSHVRSKLDYGCVVYGSARQSALDCLDRVQNAALRVCLGAFRTSPIASLHVEAGELPLTLRRQQLSLQYIINCALLHQTLPSDVCSTQTSNFCLKPDNRSPLLCD